MVHHGDITTQVPWYQGPLLGLRPGADEYLAAEERANEVVKKIARSDKVNLLGLCAGGITLSYMLAHYAATGLPATRCRQGCRS